jgi:hypothetical protein
VELEVAVDTGEPRGVLDRGELSPQHLGVFVVAHRRKSSLGLVEQRRHASGVDTLEVAHP